MHRPRGAGDVADVLRAIGGVQAQEPRASRLQLRARSRGPLAAADVERARVEERSVIRAWAMRRTAHLFATEDLEWMAPIFWERIAKWSRGRLEALGVEASPRERALGAMRTALRSRGAMTRGEAMGAVVRTGVEVDVQRRTHLSILAVVEGWACIGPQVGSEGAFVASGDWIGAWRPRGREESLAELAGRYLGAFAPASERDFAAWSGLPLGDCRLGLEAIAGRIREVQVDGGETLLAPRGWRQVAPSGSVVRLLGAYDTYLMGYATRAHAVAPEHEQRILPGGGILRPTICVDGRFAGTWSSAKSAKRLTVTLEPFGDLDPGWVEAIAAEVTDIGRFEGLEAEVACP